MVPFGPPENRKQKIKVFVKVFVICESFSTIVSARNDE